MVTLAAVFAGAAWLDPVLSEPGLVVWLELAWLGLAWLELAWLELAWLELVWLRTVVSSGADPLLGRVGSSALLLGGGWFPRAARLEAALAVFEEAEALEEASGIAFRSERCMRAPERYHRLCPGVNQARSDAVRAQ